MWVEESQTMTPTLSLLRTDEKKKPWHEVRNSCRAMCTAVICRVQDRGLLYNLYAAVSLRRCCICDQTFLCRVTKCQITKNSIDGVAIFKLDRWDMGFNDFFCACAHHWCMHASVGVLTCICCLLFLSLSKKKIHLVSRRLKLRGLGTLHEDVGVKTGIEKRGRCMSIIFTIIICYLFIYFLLLLGRWLNHFMMWHTWTETQQMSQGKINA